MIFNRGVNIKFRIYDKRNIVIINSLKERLKKYIESKFPNLILLRFC